MRIWNFGHALALIALIGVGCGSSQRPDTATTGSAAIQTQKVEKVSAGSASSASDSTMPPSPTQAQPKLRTVKLWLGAEEISAEIAVSEKEIMTGMMFRTEMGENEGMIFVFARPHQASFWMRNTLLPLSCAYIDPDGVILEEHDMKPRDETPIPAATPRVQYVLEVKQGWFERHNVKVGTQVKTERGTLAQTFFRGQ